MVIEQKRAPSEVEFSGSAKERELAKRVFELMRARGRFGSKDAPIRVSLVSIAAHLTDQGDAAAAGRLEAACAANPDVFSIVERGDERLLVTTRGGVVPQDGPAPSSHSFAERFMTPLAKPERPAQPVRERVRIDPSWAALPAILVQFEDDEDLDADADAETDTDQEVVDAVAVAAEAAPVSPSALAVEATTTGPDVSPVPVEIPPVETKIEAVSTSPAIAAEAAPIETVAVPAAEEPVPAEAAPIDMAGDDEASETVGEVEVAEEVAAAPPVVTPAAPPARTITLPVVNPTDVTGVDDVELGALVRERLQGDPRVARFGEQWMMEDRVPRFSRGDLRRFKDYVQEQEQPLPDDVLVQDVLGIRPSTPDFAVMRFAVNVRLSREHREFEFVGTSNQRFWSTTGLPLIGTSRRKPNEIGSDYRFLLEEAPTEPAYRSVASADHVLTFYEYLHGLLPYDAEMQALLPAPVMPNQKSAVLTFESPQSYTTYLVELRYPTPNRGGFILGLDDLFAENLVPGAMLTINRTDNDGHYLVEYITESGQNARLLELDERRAQRYVFRPTTYACGVEDRMLIDEERFGRLNGEKALDEKVRRRPEAVVAATFERVGDNREANFWADFPTLMAGVNIERPVSATLLRTILEQDDTGAFSRDPDNSDAYTYVPGNTP